MKTKDWILCFLVLTIWSSSSSLVAVFTKNSNPLILAGIITIVSSLILSLQFVRSSCRRMLRLLKLRDLCKLFLPALLGMFLYPISYFIGISGSSAIKANVLNYLWPLIAFVASGIFKKQSFVKSEILAMFLSVVGGYIVLFFNNSNNLSFVSSDYFYAIIALLGALFYGFYTAIIGLFCPKIKVGGATEVGKDEILLPANLRIYIMVSFSALLHILIIIIHLIVCPDFFVNTVVNIFATNKTTLCLIVYSIINFTLAHFLWNKLNTDVNVALTSSMAFLIPLASTIVLSITSKETIGFAPSFGLVFIVISIIINNRKHINSINATFVGIIIMFMLTGIVPIIKEIAIIENSKFFLEIIIALYSIYYGFVMSRVISDYKEFEALIDVISTNKRYLSCDNQGKLSQLEKHLIELKNSKESFYLQFSEQIVTLIPKDIDEEKRVFLEDKYYQLYRRSNHALSISEWLVVLILSVLILVLCFVVREGTVLSNLIVISIGAAISLCVSSLYEYEVKKNVLLNSLIE